MAAPVIGAAALLAAARLIAVQLAKQGAKKVVQQGVKKAVKPSLKTARKAKPLATPKSNVKVVPKMPKGMTKAKNDFATAEAKRIASGKAAKNAATGKLQKSKIAKEKADIADMKETLRILQRGGRVVMNPTKKSAERNGVSVIKNPTYRVNTTNK